MLSYTAGITGKATEQSHSFKSNHRYKHVLEKISLDISPHSVFHYLI